MSSSGSDVTALLSRQKIESFWCIDDLTKKVMSNPWLAVTSHLEPYDVLNYDETTIDKNKKAYKCPIRKKMVTITIIACTPNKPLKDAIDGYGLFQHKISFFSQEALPKWALSDLSARKLTNPCLAWYCGAWISVNIHEIKSKGYFYIPNPLLLQAIRNLSSYDEGSTLASKV